MKEKRKILQPIFFRFCLSSFFPCLQLIQHSNESQMRNTVRYKITFKNCKNVFWFENNECSFKDFDIYYSLNLDAIPFWRNISKQQVLSNFVTILSFNLDTRQIWRVAYKYDTDVSNFSRPEIPKTCKIYKDYWVSVSLLWKCGVDICVILW